MRRVEHETRREALAIGKPSVLGVATTLRPFEVLIYGTFSGRSFSLTRSGCALSPTWSGRTTMAPAALDVDPGLDVAATKGGDEGRPQEPHRRQAKARRCPRGLPPPLWGRDGVGVVRLWHNGAAPLDPPIPSPQGEEFAAPSYIILARMRATPLRYERQCAR